MDDSVISGLIAIWGITVVLGMVLGAWWRARGAERDNLAYEKRVARFVNTLVRVIGLANSVLNNRQNKNTTPWIDLADSAASDLAEALEQAKAQGFYGEQS